jgi:hypothetical protein
MKGWYFCVVVAGLLLSSCSQQVQERADGGKTSDTIVAEGPVEESCDSTGYRLYRKYLAAIGENPSYFQWKDFPKYLGAAYVDEKGHFVIQVLGDSAKARKQIVEVVGSDEVTVIPRRNSRQLLDSLYAYLCEIRRFRADEHTVCYDARDSWTIYVHVKALDYNMTEYVDSLYRYIGEFRKKVLLSRWVQVEGKYTVVTGVDLDEIKVKE